MFVCPLCALVNFACFFCQQLLKKNLSEIPSEFQTVWIQIRPDILLPVHVSYQTLHDGREVINFTCVAIPVILLPAHPASFAHNFVSGMQSFI